MGPINCASNPYGLKKMTGKSAKTNVIEDFNKIFDLLG